MHQELHITTEHNIRVITAAVFWDVQGSVKFYITWRFLMRNPHQILFGSSTQEERNRRNICCVSKTEEVHTGIW